MNKPTFWMMVGLPGSGKSTYAQDFAKVYNVNIHSSDAIREELSGDINNQDINDLIFKTLHSRIKEDLKNGKSCIYDACNLSYKRRMAFLQELKNTPCEKICVLIATPYEECLKRNAERERQVPVNVIERMYRSIDVPYEYEGWDDIIVLYYSDDSYYKNLNQFYRKYKHFNQDNAHHTYTLGDHCSEVCIALCDLSEDLRVAGMLHDCGKPFCKTFVNTKGEVVEQAHYYNHEHVGGYDSLFYYKPGSQIDPLYVSTLIRWHMQPYFWEKDNNEKSHNKYRKLWGEKLYQDIMKLHEADKNAH